MNRWLGILLMSASLISQGQDKASVRSDPFAGRFLIGVQAGNGWACEDEKHLFNLTAGLTIDYQIADHFFLQLAPSYYWLWTWNEHYFILPVHFRQKYSDLFSLFAGPAITFNVGYSENVGLSVGAYIHLDNRFALVLSVYAFRLYGHDTDFLYVPINMSYRYSF